MMFRSTATMKTYALLLLLALPCSLPAAEAPKPKLALCASGDKKAGDIVELMTVTLSKDGKVDLLDRASINKVLSEQKMALSGMLSTEDALKAGQLLHCDIFAELHCEKAAGENPEVTSLVAFDAVTGVRLCDTAVQNEGDLEKGAQSAIKVLRTSLGKWQGSGAESKCRTISLVSVRNVGLPESLSQIPKIMGSLLERQLLQSPEVAVLERKRLEHVNKEAAISGDRRDRLLASSVLLDLDISRGQQKGYVKIRAGMSAAGGRELAAVTAEGEADTIASLVSATVGKILDELKLATIVPAAGVEGMEADRFAMESEHLLRAGRTEESLNALDAGIALWTAVLRHDPKNQACIHQLFLLLSERVRYLAAHNGEVGEMLDALSEGLALRKEWAKDKYEGQIHNEAVDSYFSAQLVSVRRFEQRFSPAQRDEFTKIRRQYLEWYKGLCLNGQITVLDLDRVEIGTLTPDEILDVLSELAAGKAKFYARPPLGIDIGTLSMRNSVPSFPAFQTAGLKKLMAMYENWSASGDPAQRLECHFCAAVLAHEHRDIFTNYIASAQRHITAAAQDVVENPYLANDFGACLATARLDLDEDSPAELKSKEEARAAEVMKSIDDYMDGASNEMSDETSKQDRTPEEQSAMTKRAWRQTTKQTLAREMRRIVEAADKNKVACPELLLRLDAIDGGSTNPPGAWLDKAIEQIRDGTHQIRWGGWRRGYSSHSAVYRDASTKDLEEIIGRACRERYNRSPGEASATTELRLASSKKLFDIGTPTVKPGTGVKRSAIDSVELAGDWLYVLLVHRFPRTYELHRVNVVSGTNEFLGQKKSPWESAVCQIVVRKDMVYAPMSEGVIAFCLSNSVVTTVSAEQVLPSSQIDSFTEAGGFLFFGCSARNEGYLVRCHTDGTYMEMLASSGRKEKKSELDDCVNYTIRSLLDDRSRGRIVFSLDFHLERGGLNIEKYGLWSYSLDTGKIQRLNLHFKENGKGVGWEGLYNATAFRCLNDGQYTFTIGQYAWTGFMIYDPRSEELTVLAGYGETPNCGRPLYEWETTDVSIPSMALVLLADKAYVSFLAQSSNFTLKRAVPAHWQQMTRKDGRTNRLELPLLEEQAPIALFVYKNKLVAVTRTAVWLLDPSSKSESAIGEKKKTE